MSEAQAAFVWLAENYTNPGFIALVAVIVLVFFLFWTQIKAGLAAVFEATARFFGSFRREGKVVIQVVDSAGNPVYLQGKPISDDLHAPPLATATSPTTSASSMVTPDPGLPSGVVRRK